MGNSQSLLSGLSGQIKNYDKPVDLTQLKYPLVSPRARTTIKIDKKGKSLSDILELIKVCLILLSTQPEPLTEFIPHCGFVCSKIHNGKYIDFECAIWENTDDFDIEFRCYTKNESDAFETMFKTIVETLGATFTGPYFKPLSSSSNIWGEEIDPTNTKRLSAKWIIDELDHILPPFARLNAAQIALSFIKDPTNNFIFTEEIGNQLINLLLELYKVATEKSVKSITMAAIAAICAIPEANIEELIPEIIEAAMAEYNDFNYHIKREALNAIVCLITNLGIKEKWFSEKELGICILEALGSGKFENDKAAKEYAMILVEKLK